MTSEYRPRTGCAMAADEAHRREHDTRGRHAGAVHVDEEQRRHAERRHQRHGIGADHRDHAEALAATPNTPKLAEVGARDRHVARTRHRRGVADEDQPHQQRRNGGEHDRRAPVDKAQQKPGSERRQHLGQRAADRVNAERVSTAARHALGEHAGRDRVPRRVADIGQREQQGEAPELGRQRRDEIADRDPPDRRQQQAAAIGDPVRQHPRRQERERRAGPLDGEQDTDIGRRETHRRGNRRRDDPHRGRRPVVRHVAEREHGEQRTMTFASRCHRRIGHD